MDGESNKREVKSKLVFDRSDWMALLAVLISIGAFLVSIYEANILKKQQSIMVSQQKASVWPYLQAGLEIDVDEAFTSTTLFIENKGVGPAKLKSFKLYIDGKVVHEDMSIAKYLKSKFSDNQNYVHSYSSPDGVLSANTKISVLKIKKMGQNVLLDFKNIDIGYELCFCSIYGDCWTITEKNQEPVEGCNE